ncbi:MAG: ubiquitin-like protein Pup [Actinobacteria bacterium]|nr:ubiquitin-like protein Pup [Actinomycetota bacterium]MCG2797850.1 ubiquitin-like protein Pup [Cellulomonas sp.]
MAGQEHVSSRRDDEEPVDDVPAVAVPAAAAQDEAVDALLDEIDDVLEQNVEQFVRGFVQKGGQ